MVKFVLLIVALFVSSKFPKLKDLKNGNNLLKWEHM